jgi:Protein of unknown function (DUF998)
MTAIATTTAVSLNRATALAAAGPLWAVVSLTQAAARDDFDITRHPLSMLSTGSLGWIQIANFVVAGVLTIVGARALAGVWAPRLVRVAGAGLIAAGVLVMDPITTPQPPMSWHSIGHMVAGTITFAALIAACYVLARRFAVARRRGWSVAAVLSGTALLLGNGWAASGGALGTVTLAAGAITAMCFVSLVAARHR